MLQPKLEPLPYGGWPNCYRLNNGETELILTSDVGPRVVRYGFIGGQNLFVEFPDELGKSGESWWVQRGGHRLWASPEIVPDTYALDNSPLKATVTGIHLALQQPIEPETGLQKEMSVAYTPDGSVDVTHKITNAGKKVKTLAPWVLSQMAPGGVGITTFPPRGGHSEQLLPTNPLVMWAYTDFSDKRWQFTNKYLLLKQNSGDHSPQKTGLFNRVTRGAYLLGSELFVKRAQAYATLPYPDFHCSFEIFTNGDFLELETLGPLIDLKPGDSTIHVENWSLHREIKLASFTEAELDRVIEPLLK